ncbi:MAG: hypothetical protein ABIG10_01500 [bacterium]
MFDDKETIPKIDAEQPIVPKPVPVQAPSEPIKAKPELGIELPHAAKPETVAGVQSMPKEFRDYHPIAGRSNKVAGLLVMIISFVFLVSVSAGVYLYILKPYLLEEQKQPEKSKELLVVKEPGIDIQEPELPAEIIDTPKEVYAKYIAGLANVSNFDDYFNLVSEYGSQKKIQQAEADKLMVGSPGNEAEADKLIQAESAELDGNEKITEEIAGNRSVLLLINQDQELLGTIELSKENDLWKIDSIVLEGTKEELVISDDRDNDGLTDLEEDLLGSDKESADSDNDGYGDAAEVSSLYNPNGNDKLIDSPKISSYLNEIYDYLIIYPSQWAVEANDNKDSVIFRNPDNQFVNVLAMLNAKQSTVETWYKDNFNISYIDSSLVLNAESWQGIKTKDGLYIYIQGFDTKEIFMLQYYPGTDNVLDYLNIFNAMINSFVIQ